ncbi:unnamed protein product, partial [Didymodactylos carnosus]
MSKQCEAADCKRLAAALCHHCDHHVCPKHFNEHIRLIQDELHPLTDRINELLQNLTRLTLDKLLDKWLSDLEKWRDHSHQLIDNIYARKQREIQTIGDKYERNFVLHKHEQSKVIEIVKQHVNELIQEGDATYKDIEQIRMKLDNIETCLNAFQHDFVNIEIEQLKIEQDSIQVKSNMILKSIDLTILTNESKMLEAFDSSTGTLACNDQLLLLDQPSKLYLYDKELKPVGNIDWPNGLIFDYCWCQHLELFIIISHTNVFTVDVSTCEIKLIESIKPNGSFYRCTSSDNTLYISHSEDGSQINEYDLSSFEFVKRWISPKTCQLDEWIGDLRHNNTNKRFGLTIRNRSKNEFYFQIRDVQMNVISSLTIADACGLRLSLLPPYNEWLISGSCNGDCLIQITSDGKLKSRTSYNIKIRNAILFRNYILAIR